MTEGRTKLGKIREGSSHMMFGFFCQASNGDHDGNILAMTTPLIQLTITNGKKDAILPSAHKETPI